MFCLTAFASCPSYKESAISTLCSTSPNPTVCDLSLNRLLWPLDPVWWDIIPENHQSISTVWSEKSFYLLGRDHSCITLSFLSSDVHFHISKCSLLCSNYFSKNINRENGVLKSKDWGPTSSFQYTLFWHVYFIILFFQFNMSLSFVGIRDRLWFPFKLMHNFCEWCSK